MGMMNLEGENNPKNKPKPKQRLFLHHTLNSQYHIPHGKAGWQNNMPEYGVMHWITSGLITLMLTPPPKGSAWEKNNPAYGNG